MRREEPKLLELPSVCAALRWLLAESRTDARAVLLRARLRGLIHIEAGGRWKADGTLASRLARVALRRLPTTAAELGDVLHGLGEINARSQADLLAPLVHHLSRMRARVPWRAVLDVVAKRDGQGHRPLPFGVIAFTQWITRAPMGWQTFSDAAYRLNHDERYAAWRYGLKFAAKIILAIDLRVIDAWLDTHAAKSSVAVIGEAAVSMQLPWDEISGAASLLRSRKPALRCIAAAALVSPVVAQPPPLGFRDCWRALVEGGIDPGDATWMMGLRVKRAIHAHYHVESRQEQSQARLRYLEQKPEAAFGGRRNAAAELRMLRTQVDQASARHAELLMELEAMLNDFAAVWPPVGLSNAQMQNLEPIFVDRSEFRHRLAEKLAHKDNRDQLFKTNITQFRVFIGLDGNLEAAFQSHFHADERRFAIVAPWAAQSLVALYAHDRHGVGRRTSYLLDALGEASEQFVEQPFIAARKPVVWPSASARAAFAHRFALLVAACTPQDRQAEVALLRQFAIEHAFKLLCGPCWASRSDQLFDRLALQAVDEMGHFANPDDVRAQWARAKALPDFARALALWSSPALVEGDLAGALGLFRRVGEPPLSRYGRDVQMSRMLSLLDLAIASATSAARPDLISGVRDVWEAAYAEWQAITDRWADAARLLVAAVAEDGPDRRALMAEPVFANTRCRRLIDLAQPMCN